MPKPIINPNQSVPAFAQWQAFGFQPFAFHAPTSWVLTGALPPGLSMNTGTGAITGAATKPGIYSFGMQAVNAAGTSDEVSFTFGIRAGAASNSMDVDLIFDVTSRQVTPARGLPPHEGEPPAAAGGVVFRARYLDQFFTRVRLMKEGTVLDVTPSVFRLSFKADDSDPEIAASSAYVKVGTGADTYFRVYTDLSGTALKSALSDKEDVDPAEKIVVKTALRALADLKVVYVNADSATIGPASLRIASDTFRVEISRALPSA